MKIYKKIIFSLFLLSVSAWAITPSLMIDGTSAKSMGLNNAVTALDSDSLTVLEGNVGILGNKRDKDFSFGYVKWIADSYLINTAAIYPIAKIGKIGILAHYFGMTPFAIQDFDVEMNKVLSEKDFNVMVSYGNNIQIPIAGKKYQFNFGVGLKFLNNTVYNISKSSGALDAGFYVPNFFSYKKIIFNLGGVIQNLGLGMKFDSQSSGLPINVKLGVSGNYTINDDNILNFDVDCNYPTDSAFILTTGIEFIKNKLYAFRIGLQPIGKKNNIFKLGFGLNLPISNKVKAQMSYALVPIGDLGTAHSLTLAVNFF